VEPIFPPRSFSLILPVKGFSGGCLNRSILSSESQKLKILSFPTNLPIAQVPKERAASQEIVSITLLTSSLKKLVGSTRSKYRKTEPYHITVSELKVPIAGRLEDVVYSPVRSGQGPPVVGSDNFPSCPTLMPGYYPQGNPSRDADPPPQPRHVPSFPRRRRIIYFIIPFEL